MLEDKLLCLVDDDEIYRFIIERIIEKKQVPCKLMSFEDGKSLFKYLEGNREDPSKLPSIMLLDLNMPEMDGWEFIDHYSSIKSGLAKTSDIYVVTSSVNTADRDRAEALEDVKGFVEKPFDVDCLAKIVEEASA